MRASTITYCAVIAVGLAIIMVVPASTVQATTIYPGVSQPMWLGIFQSHGYFVNNMTSDHNYDVLLVTAANLDRFNNSQPFAYIEQYSRFNVSGDVYIAGDLPNGTYAVIVYPYENSTITIYEQGSVPAPAKSNGLVIPWDIIAAVTITAAATASVTFLLTRRRFVK